MAGDGGDEEDAAASLLGDHVSTQLEMLAVPVGGRSVHGMVEVFGDDELCGCLGTEEGAGGVYVEGAAPFCWGHVDGVGTAYDACKAAEDIYTAKFLSDFRHCGGEGTGVSDVDGFGDDFGGGEVGSERFNCL